MVGVEISPGDFPPQLNGGALVQVAVTPAFVATYAGRLGPSLSALVLRFRHGDADVPAFEAALRRLSSSSTNGSPYIDIRQAQQAANVQRGVHLEAVALWLLAGFAALTMILVLFQLMSRQAMLAAADHDTLRALGMTRDELWLCGMATAAAIGVVGAAGAVGVAVAASPLLPVGTARLAETHPGIAFDPLALGLGALAVLVLVPALALWPCRRAAAGALDETRQRPLDRPPLLARTAGAASLPPTASVGIGMALQPGRGRTAVPVRSSLAGVTLAVAALAAAVTFGASLTHLLDTPRLYGWNWDAHISDLTNTSAAGIRSAMPALVADQRIEAVAIARQPSADRGPGLGLVGDA